MAKTSIYLPVYSVFLIKISQIARICLILTYVSPYSVTYCHAGGFAKISLIKQVKYS